MFARSWLKGVVQQRIIVHTISDQSIDASLVAVMKDGIVLRAAKLLSNVGPATAMSGEVFVPRGNIAFAQLDEAGD